MYIIFVLFEKSLTIINCFIYQNADFNLYICPEFNFIVYDHYYRSN